MNGSLEWVVKGASLETGEPVERRFQAESEGTARAMAKVAGIAVESVSAAAAVSREEPLAWKVQHAARIRSESQEHQSLGQFPVVVKNFPQMVMAIAIGIVVGNFLWWMLVILLLDSIAGARRSALP